MKPYDLTLLSILRDSTPYLERYAAQLRAAAVHFERVHAIWVEGDSQDDTQHRLRDLAAELPIDVTLVECKTGGADQAKKQRAHMRVVRNSGGVYIVTRNRLQMRADIEAIGFQPRLSPT